MDKDLASMQEARALARQAEIAQQQLKRFSQDKLDAIVHTISLAFLDHAENLGKMACQETGFGNPADKAE